MKRTLQSNLCNSLSKHVIRELKTDSSQNRLLVVPPEVIEALKEYKRIKKREYEKIGYNDLVHFWYIPEKQKNCGPKAAIPCYCWYRDDRI